uniref:Uncharacterized protein n=1 Tax=Cannabis sativa TaxID=3483 RepID=A0A803QBZ1_CANSA
MKPGNQSEPTIEEQYANVRIEDEEEDSLVYVGDNDDLTEIDDRWCLSKLPPTNLGSSSNHPIIVRDDKTKMVANSLPLTKTSNVVVDHALMEDMNAGDIVMKPNAINKETSILVLDTKRRRTDIVDGSGPGLDNNGDQNKNVAEEVSEVTTTNKEGNTDGYDVNGPAQNQ